ncbi:hypothetical protein TNCV_43701 [Trichonephila clavipes]|nr:hypothetical protein TNCV_43701 [Trichonephila clavipes]
MSKKDLNTRIARWALNLQDYDYTILHRSGSQMAHVDALSRIQSGKQEGFLHPLVKDDIPLNTYHIDHLGPLATSSKNYTLILAVIDSFTKFVWLYPTKTTSTSEVIKKLDIHETTFGNPRFLITDRGTTFTSDEFHTYCSEQKITIHHITTGLPRANGQVERFNRTIIPVLSKMSEDDPTKWFKHVPSLQEVLNSTFQRSINTTPFELLFGTQINNKTDLRIQQLIDEQLQLEFNENRELLRKAAKAQIVKVQNQNKKSYNLRRKPPYLYSVKDLVAIKKTQQGPGQKLCNKFIGPYKITQKFKLALTFQDGDRFNSCQVIYSQFGLAIHQNDHQARRRFVEWAQNEIAVVPDFHKRILFSDEAHFWLNGYVNKRNSRFRSEANPQVYVETPLHPEKLTVWCALWAGGILLQKR